jgi:hypothetical protein
MALVLTLPGLAACGHDRLDFSASGGDGGATAVGCDDAGRCADASIDAMQVGSSDENMDAGASVNGGPSSAPGLHFNRDPDGYPTTLGHWAPWCAEMKSFTELCDTGIDEDCDGRVDEFMGLGDSCMNGCYEGVYVCNTQTNSLVCQGPGGCTNELPPPCGDGFVEADEECDPNAADERSGITCTVDCHRPLFILCVTTGTPDPSVCDALHKCNERIGACVPVIGPQQRRCPNIRVEGGTDGDFYPMLETEDGECVVTCSKPEQCPGILSDCYMGFCAAPF